MGQWCYWRVIVSGAVVLLVSDHVSGAVSDHGE